MGRVLVAPTEPASLRALGKVSSTPEKFGADFLLTSPSYGTVGVQRKEMNDFVASVRDGRLGKELAQMKALGLGVLLIEGKPQWTVDGSLMSRASWTRAQHLGTLCSVASMGYWTMSSSGVDETASWLQLFTKWIGKKRGIGKDGETSGMSGVMTKPKATSDEWGNVGSREWGVWLLQSFDGIGLKVANEIYNHFGGVPLSWDVTEEELRGVKGIGKGRARKLMEALERRETKHD